MKTVRRFSALALVGTLWLIGLLSAHAADEEPRSLASAGLSSPRPLANRTLVVSPQVRASDGASRSLANQPLAEFRVELDNPSRMWRRRSVTTTDAHGAFALRGTWPWSL